MIETKCYKCEAVTFADREDVHPLCTDCNDQFVEWFNDQLNKLDRKAG